MNSVDSLDTMSTVSSGGSPALKQDDDPVAPPDVPVVDNDNGNWQTTEETTTTSSAVDNWKQHLGHVVGDASNLNAPKRSTSMSSGSTTASGGSSVSNSTAGGHHAHSHSDSGLSSLGHGGGVVGRTSTMSPVSTMSTVSSVSSNASHATSANSNPSAGSSRASLRSASIVSNTGQTPPESLKEVSGEDEHDDADADNAAGSSADRDNKTAVGSNDSGTGTLRKGGIISRKFNKLQEELDCEELSRELFNDGGDYKMQSLFGE